jgi:hypothetical protein
MSVTWTHKGREHSAFRVDCAACTFYENTEGLFYDNKHTWESVYFYKETSRPGPSSYIGDSQVLWSMVPPLEMKWRYGLGRVQSSLNQVIHNLAVHCYNGLHVLGCLEHHSLWSTCVSSAICELRIPQKDLGRRFFLVALNSQPMWESQAAHNAIVHEYLRSKSRAYRWKRYLQT